MNTSTTAPLVVRGLCKSYGGRPVVRGLDLDLRPGEILGFLGPNGAGKSTALEIIEGLRPRDAGSIRFFGRTEDGLDDATRARIGVQLQSTGFLPHLGVAETLALFTGMYPGARSDLTGLIETFDLTSIRRARVKTLSGGQRQRLALACAVAHEPELVFLDEPTTGLDTQSRHALWDLIRMLRARGKTVLLTTHYMNEAEVLADRIAIIDGGALVEQGTPSELKNRHGGPDLESVFLALTGKALREQEAV